MKRLHVLYAISFGLIMSICIASAHADTVSLTCKAQYGNAEAKVTFDESAGTAGFAAFGDVPVSKAKFTENEITWEYRYPSGHTYFSLNRMTGTLTQSGNQNWQCSVAKKQF
jgi:hypothetical protein